MRASSIVIFPTFSLLAFGAFSTKKDNFLKMPQAVVSLWLLNCGSPCRIQTISCRFQFGFHQTSLKFKSFSISIKSQNYFKIMIFLKRFLKIAIWIFIGSCLWVMAAFFGSNYTIEIFVQETRRSSFEKLNLFGSIGKIFDTQQELLIEIIENFSLSCCFHTPAFGSGQTVCLVWSAYLS